MADLNVNEANACFGQAKVKKFENDRALLLAGEQPAPDLNPLPQPFHQGSGDFHWDIQTRYLVYYLEKVDKNGNRVILTCQYLHILI